MPLPSMNIGDSATVRLFLDVPPSVTRFSLTENGTVQNFVGSTYNFSLAQSVIP
jgi:hypothetical protein